MALSPWCRRLALGGLLLLIGLLLVESGGGLAALLALPLLLPMPGLWRGRAYTAAWASMLLAFYVALFLSEGYAEPARQLRHFGLASLSALVFVSLLLFVRLGARERQALTAASASRTAGSDADAR